MHFCGVHTFFFIFKIKALFRASLVYIILGFGVYVILGLEFMFYKKPTILNLNAPLEVIFS